MKYILTAVRICLADLFLKRLIGRLIPEGEKKSLEKIPVTLENHHNYGFACNKMDKRPDIVRNISLVILAAVMAFLLILLPMKGKKGLKTGAALIVGGGLSNLADRFCLGYVQDYIRFRTPFRLLNKMIFNIGDLCIFTGTAVLFAVSLLKKDRK